MGKGCLPPGFRFHPTDVELVKYYLKRKVMGRKLHTEAITELDIYKHAPWDLPDKALLTFGDLKWFFFCPVEKKYAKGARKSRATEVGYWKTTGRDRPVVYDQDVVGMIKTLVFHLGKAPKGDRTDWVMHEYRLEDKNLADKEIVQDAYVLCVVFKKDGPGPRNGAQYGAPFNEHDWSDDDEMEEEEEDGPGAVSSVAVCSLNPVSSVAAADSIALETTCIVPSAEPVPEDDLLSYYNTLPGICLDEVLPPVYERPDAPAFMGGGSSTVGQGDDISSMMDIFTEESSLRWNNEEQRFEVDNSYAVFSAALLSQPSSLENLNWSNIAAGTCGGCHIPPPKQSTTEPYASLTLPAASEMTEATVSPTFLEALQFSGDDNITLMLAAFSDDNAAALYHP